MGSSSVIIKLSIIFLNEVFSWKVMLLVTEKRTPSAVFNLQALDCVQCEEEAGMNRERSIHTYTLVKKNLN